MENELIIPADLQARAMVDGWSQQQLNEEAMKLEINNAPAPTPDPVIDTTTPTITQDELQQMASGSEPAVGSEPQAPVAPSLN